MNTPILQTAYAFRGKDIICLSSPLLRGSAAETWVHVASCGEWHGHTNGAFAFTAETFRQCVANFEANVNPCKIDYDHETLFERPPLPARGWVHELELRGTNEDPQLWAFCAFNEEAATLIKKGGFPFCSGVFEMNATHPVSGEKIGCHLTSLALTAQPYLDGQTPIVLSQRAAQGEPMALKEDEKLEEADKPDESMKEEEQAEEVALAEEQPSKMLADLAERMELELPALEALLEEKMEALMALLKGEEPASELPLSAANQTIRALSVRVQKAEERLSAYEQKEASVAVSELIEKGVLLDSGREEMQTLYLSNRKTFDAITSALPTVVPTGEHAAATDKISATATVIDEADPAVIAKRVFLSKAGVSKEDQDKALMKELNAQSVRV